VAYLTGNNHDKTPSMFWESVFENGEKFDLELRYGTVILTALRHKKRTEIIIGYTSDFPDVKDVVSLFKNWVCAHPEALT
jgi:hypothetical protein